MSTISSTSGSSSVATGTGTAATTSTYGPIATTAEPDISNLAKQAVNLSNDASLIVNIGNNTASTPLYTAQGLMASLMQATSQNTPASTTPSTAAASGTSTDNSASGSSSATATDPTNWTNILQANPAMVGAFQSDAVNHLLVNSLSTTA